jgi:hypothetical protein
MHLNNTTATGPGFGWIVEIVEGRRNVGDCGATTDFDQSAKRLPARPFFVILLTNTHESVGMPFAPKIVSYYLGLEEYPLRTIVNRAPKREGFGFQVPCLQCVANQLDLGDPAILTFV